MEKMKRRLSSEIGEYDWQYQTDGHQFFEDALAAVKNWVYFTCLSQWCGNDPYWLTLIGPSETGKSHLAFRAAQAVRTISARIPVPVYRSTQHRLKEVEADSATTSVIAERALNDRAWLPLWRRIPALVIDEVGVETASNSTRWDIVYSILSERAEMGTTPPKATIITANLTLKEIGEQLDKRLQSRIRRGRNVIVEIPNDAPGYHDIERA